MATRDMVSVPIPLSLLAKTDMVHVYDMPRLPLDFANLDIGRVLQVSPETPVERWTPAVVVLKIFGDALPFVRYWSNSLKLWIYDPSEGFLKLFAERSTIKTEGDTVTFSILPNGGWWTNQFRLKFIAGVELE